MTNHGLPLQWIKNLKPVARRGLLASMALLMGCASTSTTETASSKVPPLPAGITLREDKDIQGVWLSDGFDFRGYETLYIANPVFAAIERPNEVQMRAMAMRVLPEELANHIRNTKLFATVTTNADDVTPGTKSLRVENTIVEYEKGGGGARYWAGIYGGGQPVIKVRGHILDGEKLMCVYELRRSGESGVARVFGAFQSDEEIQRNDIRDLASDLVDFFKRTAKVQ
jgi:hypothetical protein